MFCIAVFIVFGILAVFSASYRPLAAKAWHCVVRRVTFRPCDITFGEEMKGKLIGKLVFSHPRLARFLDRWIDVFSFLFVALSIWSLVYVFNAGLNLWVYDTCNPSNGESCSLSGEACGIDQGTLGFIQSVRENRVGEWAAGPFVRFTDTLTRIPDRLKTWNASEFIAPTATYHGTFDAQKPTVLEIIDPGCKYCRKLTMHLREAGVFQAANVTYLLFPIPLPEKGGYKFPHSRLIASYIEAVKHFPIAGDVPGDWQLLERVFAEPEGTEIDLQTRFNIGMNAVQAEEMLQTLLREIGYSDAEIRAIATAAASEEVRTSLDAQRVIVQERVRTVKIPTLLLGGRRYDRVIPIDTLRAAIENALRKT